MKKFITKAHSPQCRRARQMQRIDDVRNAEHSKDVEEHAVDLASAHAEQHVARIFADHVNEWDCNLAPLLLQLGKFRRLHDPQADVETDDHQDDAGDKSDAPAPGKKLLLRQSGCNRDDACREAQPDRETDLRQALEQPPLVLGRVFVRHQNRPTPFSAKPDALQHAQDQKMIGAATPFWL